MSSSSSTEQQNHNQLVQREVENVNENRTRLDDMTNNDKRNGEDIFAGDKEESSTFLNDTDVEVKENVELQQIVVDQGVRTSDSKSSTQKEDENLDEVV